MLCVEFEVYNKSSPFASGSIHDPPRCACVAIARLCGIALGAPIGSCDAPQAASNAVTTQQLNSA
jgi:hypothetical protein